MIESFKLQVLTKGTPSSYYLLKERLIKEKLLTLLK